MSDRQLVQIAPYPDALRRLVEQTTYRRGWTVELFDDYPRDFAPDDHRRTAPIGRGMTFVITTDTVNSYNQDQRIRVSHLFIVPAATYNESSWRRWLFEQFVLVERHEAAEFFTVDGAKPFAPLHGPGEDPYTVVEFASDEQRRTSFRGLVNE